MVMHALIFRGTVLEQNSWEHTASPAQLPIGQLVRGRFVVVVDLTGCSAPASNHSLAQPKARRLRPTQPALPGNQRDPKLII